MEPAEKLKQLAKNAGFNLLFLPPYSPDFNPIEKSWANLKRWLKDNLVHYPQFNFAVSDYLFRIFKLKHYILPPAAKFLKKLNDKKLKALYQKAIDDILLDSSIGDAKTGDLSGVFGIVAERYRNRRKRFGLRMSLFCGLYHDELVNA